MQPRSVYEALNAPRTKTRFLVPKILPYGGLLTIHGAEKSFKSRLARNFAMQCAESGTVWCKWMAATKSKVFYVDQELSEDMFLDSIEKIQNKERYLDAPHNLYYVCKDYELRLDTDAGFNLLKDYVLRIEPDILILDPWSELHPYEDSDTPKQLALLRRIRGIRDGQPITTVIVHHDCKPGEYRRPGDPSSIRGAALLQASDSIIGVVKGREDVVRFNFRLRHDGEPNGGVPFDLHYDEPTDTFWRKVYEHDKG